MEIQNTKVLYGMRRLLLVEIETSLSETPSNSTLTPVGNPVLSFWVQLMILAQQKSEYTPSEFVYFQKLPLEIQDMVWESIVDDRIVLVIPSGDKKHILLAYPYTPKILHISKRARLLGLKSHTLFLNQRHQTDIQQLPKNQIYINFEKDTFLSLNINRDRDFSQRCPATLGSIAFCSHIKHLALDVADPCQYIMLHFPALKTVTILRNVRNLRRMSYDLEIRNYVQRFSFATIDPVDYGVNAEAKYGYHLKVFESLINQKLQAQPSWMPFKLVHGDSVIQRTEEETHLSI